MLENVKNDQNAQDRSNEERCNKDIQQQKMQRRKTIVRKKSNFWFNQNIIAGHCDALLFPLRLPEGTLPGNSAINRHTETLNTDGNICNTVWTLLRCKRFTLITRQTAVVKKRLNQEFVLFVIWGKTMPNFASDYTVYTIFWIPIELHFLFTRMSLTLTSIKYRLVKYDSLPSQHCTAKIEVQNQKQIQIEKKTKRKV